jgi:hypothetical protein
MDEQKVAAAAQKVADVTQSDVMVFNGDVTPGSAKRLIDVICARKRAKRLHLLLVTNGGDPDAAFKIGRAVQNSYDHVTMVIAGWCKSAGTLVAIAGNDLVIGDRGELGPLDIQIAKADEIMELGSGLAVDQALKTLETTASRMFLNLLVGIRRDTQGMITTKTAADIAAKMVTGLLEPIYHQIDPVKIGENGRAMNITKMYGARLNTQGGNLRTQNSLEWLVGLYPDHGFVIDRTEARMLFTNVSEPNPALVSLIDAMGEFALAPSPSKDGPQIRYLSTEVANEEKSEPGNAPATRRRRRAAPVVARARANGRAAPNHDGGVG